MKNNHVIFLVLLFLQQGCTTTLGLHPDNQQAQQQKQRWLSWYQSWAGTPHRLGGNSRSGIDCSAYVQRGYRKFYGIELPRTARAQRRQGRNIRYQQLTTGDLVFFKPDSYPSHVGIYLGDGSFIHVSKSKGVIRSRLDQGYWYKHFHTATRIYRTETPI